jgi:hypothetical protein
MGKPSAPPPPDYAAAATAQGAADRDTAVFNAGMNRPTELDPYGMRTWTLRPGADPQNPQPGDYVVSTSLAPEQQGLLDSQNRISQSFLNTGEAGLGRVAGMLGTAPNISGAPALRGGVNSYLGGTQQLGPGAPLQTSLPGGLPGLDSASDATRQRVEQALFSRIRPEFERREAASRNRLLNTGFEVGSEGSNAELDQLGRDRNDAEMQAILAGGSEMSRLLGEQRANRGQLYGEQLSAGQFGNQALGQQFQQGAQAAGFNNDLLQQLFGRELAGSTFNNQARQQSIAETLMMRQLPLNEINALRSGVQVGGLQPAQFYSPQAGAAPTFDASLAQGNYDQNSYQNQQQGYNGLMGGMATLGSAALMVF